MALVDWPKMRAEGNCATMLASYGFNPYFSDQTMQGGTPISPVSALAPALNSTGLLSGMDGAYPPSASASSVLGQDDLGERLQQLLALQQSQQACGQQNQGSQGLSQSQMLSVFTNANLSVENEANELLALQAALSGQETPRGSQNGRVGPNNNPLYKVSNHS